MGFGKDNKGVILREALSIAFGALGANSVIKATSIGVALQTTSFRIIKTEFFVAQASAWAADGDAVIIGICNGELSAGEIAECIQANGPDDRNDRVTDERASRAVWLLVHMKDQPETGFNFSLPANDGQPMVKNLRWTFTPTEGWAWFAFNPLSGALTTGAAVNIKATHYGVWVD